MENQLARRRRKEGISRSSWLSAWLCGAADSTGRADPRAGAGCRRRRRCVISRTTTEQAQKSAGLLRTPVLENSLAKQRLVFFLVCDHGIYDPADRRGLCIGLCRRRDQRPLGYDRLWRGVEIGLGLFNGRRRRRDGGGGAHIFMVWLGFGRRRRRVGGRLIGPGRLRRGRCVD